jgi:hypothetical protein
VHFTLSGFFVTSTSQRGGDPDVQPKNQRTAHSGALPNQKGNQEADDQSGGVHDQRRNPPMEA